MTQTFIEHFSKAKNRDEVLSKMECDTVESLYEKLNNEFTTYQIFWRELSYIAGKGLDGNPAYTFYYDGNNPEFFEHVSNNSITSFFTLIYCSGVILRSSDLPSDQHPNETKRMETLFKN